MAFTETLISDVATLGDEINERKQYTANNLDYGHQSMRRSDIHTVENGGLKYSFEFKTPVFEFKANRLTEAEANQLLTDIQPILTLIRDNIPAPTV